MPRIIADSILAKTCTAMVSLLDEKCIGIPGDSYKNNRAAEDNEVGICCILLELSTYSDRRIVGDTASGITRASR